MSVLKQQNPVLLVSRALHMVVIEGVDTKVSHSAEPRYQVLPPLLLYKFVRAVICAVWQLESQTPEVRAETDASPTLNSKQVQQLADSLRR